MQPFERALQKELRREATQVSIPDDMWGNISRQLDAERATLEHRRIQRNLFQRKSAMALVAAAGIFWIVSKPLDLVAPPVESTPPFTVLSASSPRTSENVPWEDIRKGPIGARSDHNPADLHMFEPQVTPR